MTTRLWLVRHGRAAAGWAEDADPGLDEEGRAQAEAAADRVAGLTTTADLVTSPLRRARETAAPLAARWGVEAVVDPAVGEVPSPTEGLAERGAWLDDLLRSRWSAQPPALRDWREDVLAWCASRATDTVVFTHFVVVNVVLGAATGDDRVVRAMVANGSVVTVDAGPGGLRLVDLGAEGATTVL